jgi:hypothetical protein
MARTLPFVRKPCPAKASIDTQRRTLHVLRDLQVLCRLAPASVAFLEHCAADLRLRAELSAQGSNGRSIRGSVIALFATMLATW